MKGLLLESERYNNAGTGESISIDWTKIDINSSSLRIIYKNAADNPDLSLSPPTIGRM